MTRGPQLNEAAASEPSAARPRPALSIPVLGAWPHAAGRGSRQATAPVSMTRAITAPDVSPVSR